MRAVIAEDSVLLREGVARVLDEAGFDVVAQCGTADELLLTVRSFPPDVAIERPRTSAQLANWGNQ